MTAEFQDASMHNGYFGLGKLTVRSARLESRLR